MENEAVVEASPNSRSYSSSFDIRSQVYCKESTLTKNTVIKQDVL
jgi:hypothetical protein